MARRLIWTESVRYDLDQAADYIAQDSPARARAFIDRVRSVAESLTDLPHLGRVVPELGDADLREVLIGRYRLVYRIRGDGLFVVRLIHGARDAP